jgi:hypothetical protein
MTELAVVNIAIKLLDQFPVAFRKKVNSIRSWDFKRKTVGFRLKNSRLELKS